MKFRQYSVKFKLGVTFLIDPAWLRFKVKQVNNILFDLETTEMEASEIEKY